MSSIRKVLKCRAGIYGVSFKWNENSSDWEKNGLRIIATCQSSQQTYCNQFGTNVILTDVKPRFGTMQSFIHAIQEGVKSRVQFQIAEKDSNRTAKLNFKIISVAQKIEIELFEATIQNIDQASLVADNSIELGPENSQRLGSQMRKLLEEKWFSSALKKRRAIKKEENKLRQQLIQISDCEIEDNQKSNRDKEEKLSDTLLTTFSMEQTNRYRMGCEENKSNLLLTISKILMGLGAISAVLGGFGCVGGLALTGSKYFMLGGIAGIVVGGILYLAIRNKQ